MRISDWSSDVCSSDLIDIANGLKARGDPRLLQIALENLLGNAWKFTAGRSPARIELGQGGRDMAYFVRDNGVGFDMAYADQLFRAFQRLHDMRAFPRSEEHTSELQSLMRISYAVFCLKKKNNERYRVTNH